MAKTAKPFRYRYGHVDLDERFRKFLDEACSMPLLTNDEVIVLAKKIKNGDIKSRDKLGLANMRFVVSVANRYQFQGLSLKDLVMEGCVGLFEATKRFDETRGFTFITYAVWWIRQAILSALAEQSRIVRLPINRAATVSEVRKLSNSNELSQKYAGRVPAEVIAREIKLPLDEVEEAIRMADSSLSLDESNNEDITLGSFLEDETQPPPDAEVMSYSRMKALRSVLDSLTSKQTEVIDLYFGLTDGKPKTLKEIGDRYGGTSKEWIRQIKDQAMRRLRHPSRLDLLAELYFDKGPVESIFSELASEKSEADDGRDVIQPQSRTGNKKADFFNPRFFQPGQMRIQAAETSEFAFSQMGKKELRYWLLGLEPIIRNLEPDLAENLCLYYGLFGAIPRSLPVFKKNGNVMNENKEYALTALVRETDIEYRKLKAIFKRHLELIAHQKNV